MKAIEIYRNGDRVIEGDEVGTLCYFWTTDGKTPDRNAEPNHDWDCHFEPFMWNGTKWEIV